MELYIVTVNTEKDDNNFCSIIALICVLSIELVISENNKVL
jgi:hypothetical protein